MIEIISATTQHQINQIAILADEIWREYYIPMVGKPQIDYMLEKFQSAEAIKNQVDTGFEYFIITFDAIPVSYIAIKKEEEALFLSKIYVLKSYRGKKIAKTALQFIEQKAKDYNLKTIRLTVNINNVTAIKAYNALGFKNADSIKLDIGNGFFMDDFLMKKEL
ncbi:GNAT family N-acetyltransferase [Mariniflexile jejuense]|uniref:GNAT family N-acetyltransferase n=1 Tax=Mariniflexile jejuense TaxID=1173582 RepID=A0ABW3JK68_9FLAO